jgi:hypothetical protein
VRAAPRRWWSGRLVAAVAGVVLAGVAVSVLWGRDRERSVEGTVRDFFAARADGDCARLLELLSEASWSDGGRLSRRQFLRSCRDVVGEHRPDLVGVDVVSEEGDRAVVNLSVLGDPAQRPERHDGVLVATGEHPPLAYEVGQLVREGGEWKVRADQRFLRIGRSVEQTVRRFVDLFNDDDCERQVDLLSPAAMSAGGSDGRRRREEYVDRCRTAAESRPAHVDALGVPDTVEVTLDPDDDRTATARWHPVSDVGEAADPFRPSTLAETVTLVREGLAWKLDRLPGAVHDVELQARLLPEPPPGVLGAAGSHVQLHLQQSFPVSDEGSDAREQRARAGFVRGDAISFGTDDPDALETLDVVLYEFEDGDGARRYAEHLAERVGQGAGSVSPAPVPSVADVRAAVTRCAEPSAGGGCARGSNAVGLGVSGRFLTAAWLYDSREPAVGELTGRVEEVVRAQLDRL